VKFVDLSKPITYTTIMSNIQSQFSIIHSASGLNLSSGVIRKSDDTNFTPLSVTIGDTDTEIRLGGVTSPRDAYIKFMSGDPVLIGFSEGVYPMCLTDKDEWLKIRLNTLGEIPVVHLKSIGTSKIVTAVAPN
jgi:hypothetical protein